MAAVKCYSEAILPQCARGNRQSRKQNDPVLCSNGFIRVPQAARLGQPPEIATLFQVADDGPLYKFARGREFSLLFQVQLSAKFGNHKSRVPPLALCLFSHVYRAKGNHDFSRIPR